MRKTWHRPHCEKMFETQQAMKQDIAVKHDGTATQKYDKFQHSFGISNNFQNYDGIQNTFV